MHFKQIIAFSVLALLATFHLGCDITPNIHPVSDDEYAIYTLIAAGQTAISPPTQASVVVIDTTIRPVDQPDDMPQNTESFLVYFRTYRKHNSGSPVLPPGNMGPYPFNYKGVHHLA